MIHTHRKIHHSLFLFIVIFLGGVITAACYVAPTHEPEYAPSPIPSDTSTPTIVWFPPTATYTPFPTPAITPTVDIKPQVGEILLVDDFSDPLDWNLAVSDTSSAAFGQDELTLAVSAPGAYLFSLRKTPVINDFYLEITASPSICQGEDEYGVLFRVSPALEFFRFSLSCDGYIRLDRVLKGRASTLFPRTISGAVPPGAPSSSRIAIWAKGRDISFFVNNEFIFDIRDASLGAGSIGVFTRSAGGNAVTISFSNLVIRDVN